MSDRSTRRNAVLFTPKEVSKVQKDISKEKARQAKLAKQEYEGLINTFRSSDDMHERARVAQQIIASKDDDRLDDKGRQMVNGYISSLKLKEYTSLYRTTQDLQEVGLSSDVTVKDKKGARSLDELAKDPHLDGMARNVAKQYLKYQPEYDKLEALEKWSKLPDPKPPKPPEPNLPNGETFENGNLMRDGKVVLKLQGGTDARSIGMAARAMESVLQPEGVDNNTNRLRTKKPPWDLRKYGMTLGGNMGDGSSETVKQISEQVLIQGKQVDPRRTKEVATVAEKAYEKDGLKIVDRFGLT